MLWNCEVLYKKTYGIKITNVQSNICFIEWKSEWAFVYSRAGPDIDTDFRYVLCKIWLIMPKS